MCGNLTGLLPLLMHFSSQLVRSAKARLETLDAEANTSVSHSMFLSAPSDVMPSSSQEVRLLLM